MLKKYFFLFFILFQFDDFLSVELFNFFWQPSRILIVLSIFMFLNDVLVHNMKSTFTRYEKSILFYSLIHILSLILSPFSFLTKLSYFLYDLFFIFFVLNKNDNFSLVKEFRKYKVLLFFLFFLNVSLYFISLFNESISNYMFGLYDRIMYGIFLERLYFCFAIISCVHIIIFVYKPNFVFRALLLLLSSICVLGSLSFSGILALLTFIPYILEGKINFGVKIITFAFIALMSVLVFQGKIFSTGTELESASIKTEKYFSEDMTESNWRIFSSIFLIESFVSDATLVGNGFRSNWYFLKDLIPNADDDKFVSSHTFLSLTYDSGFLGLFIILYFLYAIISTMRFSNFLKFSGEIFSVIFLNNVFLVFILIHFFFYYQEYLPIYYLFPVYLNSAKS